MPFLINAFFHVEITWRITSCQFATSFAPPEETGVIQRMLHRFHLGKSFILLLLLYYWAYNILRRRSWTESSCYMRGRSTMLAVKSVTFTPECHDISRLITPTGEIFRIRLISSHVLFWLRLSQHSRKSISGCVRNILIVTEGSEFGVNSTEDTAFSTEASDSYGFPTCALTIIVVFVFSLSRPSLDVARVVQYRPAVDSWYPSRLRLHSGTVFAV